MTPGTTRALKRGNPRSRGQTRAAESLAAARDLLAGGVGEQFTLRNVADLVGIRLSHLQYYFPTKADLVRALLASVAADYSATTAEVLAAVPNTPTARFMAWIDYLLLDCWDPRVRHFFIRLWGLVESEDANSGQLLQEFYATDIALIARLLMDLSPHVSEELRLHRAAIIAGSLRG
jgi:AcrR family transcriptional regulator